MMRCVLACAVATGFAMTEAVMARPFDLEVFLHVIGSDALPYDGYRYIDSQEQVSIAIMLVNQSDVPVQLPTELDSLLQVELVRSDSEEPVVALRERVVKWRRAENVPTLSPMVGRDSVEVTFHFRPVGAALGPGSYRLRVDISNLGARLTASDGTPWRGTWTGAFEKTVLVSPSANRAEWIRGRALRASAHAIRGEQQAARAAFLELVRVAPDSPVGPLGLGRLELQRRNYPEAAAWLQRVLDLGVSPESHTPRMLALAYVGAGQDKRAHAILRRNLSERETDDEIARLKTQIRRAAERAGR